MASSWALTDDGFFIQGLCDCREMHQKRANAIFILGQSHKHGAPFLAQDGEIKHGVVGVSSEWRLFCCW